MGPIIVVFFWPFRAMAPPNMASPLISGQLGQEHQSARFTKILFISLLN